jgi:hypothetical protein
MYLQHQKLRIYTNHKSPVASFLSFLFDKYGLVFQLTVNLFLDLLITFLGFYLMKSLFRFFLFSLFKKKSFAPLTLSSLFDSYFGFWTSHFFISYFYIDRVVLKILVTFKICSYIMLIFLNTLNCNYLLSICSSENLNLNQAGFFQKIYSSTHVL